MQDNPLVVDSVDTQIAGIYALVKGRVNFETIVPTVIEVAKEIEAIEGLRGSKKLELLQKVLKLAVKDSDMDADKKEHTLHIIDTVVPIIAQAAVLASKSPLIAQVEATCVGCWTKK
jgi:hypothetical protein